MLFPAKIYSPAPSVSISAAASISDKGLMGTEISSGREIPAAAGAWREEIYTFPINQIIAGAAKAESKPESSVFCSHSSPRCRLRGCNYSIPPGASGSGCLCKLFNRAIDCKEGAQPGISHSLLAPLSGYLYRYRGRETLCTPQTQLHVSFLWEIHPKNKQPVVRQQGAI